MSHAVVIGGSITGLFAARVLSDHFERVTIIERDQYPQAPDFRPGTPQVRHGHLLLSRGQGIMCDLFPALEADLVRAHVPEIRWGKETALLTPSGWMQPIDSGIVTYACSRPQLEWSVRQHLSQIPNVEFMTETKVLHLYTNEAKNIITGVEIQPRQGGGSHIIAANLVVDTSGRRSKATEWLQSLGYAEPQETTVNAFIGYATRWYAVPEDFQAAWKLLIIQARPADKNYRTGGIARVEGNRWIVTMGGANRDYPPTDEAGFLEFAKGLVSPEIYNVIRHAQPITEIFGYRDTENHWRHYENLPARPDNFIIMGDAVCAFNPVYAQGMTMAGLEAQLLDQLLAHYQPANLSGFATQFQVQLAKNLKNAWLMATSGDMLYPDTEGVTPSRLDRLGQRFFVDLINLIPQDEALSRTFLQVMHMLVPPTALARPGYIFKVLQHRFQPKPTPAATLETLNFV